MVCAGSISEKQAETMIALAVSITECQEALSERQLGKQTCDTWGNPLCIVPHCIFPQVAY